LVVVNSRGLEDSLRASLGSRCRDVKTVRNPIDFNLIDTLAQEPPLCSKEKRIPLVISVGRLHRQKRVDVLLDAFSKLLTSREAALWICGDGYLRSHIEHKVCADGLADRVSLLGFCPNPYPLIRQADLFVLTSDYEGMPNALIEAMALGVPCVATRCPYGPEEIVADGKTGFLAGCGNPGDVARGIERALSGGAARIAVRGAERVREMFAVQHRMKEWEALLGHSRIQTALGNRKNHPRR
jgi:glycosyltransferase involved in cell wall biosynthesis